MTPTRAARLTVGEPVRLVGHPDAHPDRDATVLRVHDDGSVDVLAPQTDTFATAIRVRARSLRATR